MMRVRVNESEMTSLRLSGACEAAVEGAVAACKGLPLHTVSNSGYKARSLNADCWESGWTQAAYEIDSDAVHNGECPGL